MIYHIQNRRAESAMMETGNGESVVLEGGISGNVPRMYMTCLIILDTRHYPCASIGS